MAWTGEEEARLEELFWDHTYNELAELLDRPRGTVQGKAARMDLPEKTIANELEWRYGVPLDWLLDTLHNTLDKPITRMAEELDVSHGWVQNQMADRNIYNRGCSEAAELRMAELSKAERKRQTAKAREGLPDYEEKKHPLVKWREENPEQAKEMASQHMSRMVTTRDENPMEGVSGQDSPTWLGGRSIYDAVKKQLHGPSWQSTRSQYLADKCRVCKSDTDLILHHIVPLMAGGTNDEYNYMTLCRSCHGTVEWHICRNFSNVLAE